AGGYISPIFLPSPPQVVGQARRYLTDGSLFWHVLTRGRRGLGGFVLAPAPRQPLLARVDERPPGAGRISARRRRGGSARHRARDLTHGQGAVRSHPLDHPPAALTVLDPPDHPLVRHRRGAEVRDRFH